MDTETPAAAIPGRTPRKAVIAIHGIGQQVEFETIDNVMALLGEAEGTKHEVDLLPTEDGRSFPVGRTTIKGDGGAEVKVDVFEAYWARHAEGPVKLWDVGAFFLNAARRGLRTTRDGTFDRALFGLRTYLLPPKHIVLHFYLALALLVSALIIGVTTVGILLSSNPLGERGRVAFDVLPHLTNDVMALALVALLGGLTGAVLAAAASVKKVLRNRFKVNFPDFGIGRRMLFGMAFLAILVSVDTALAFVLHLFGGRIQGTADYFEWLMARPSGERFLGLTAVVVGAVLMPTLSWGLGLYFVRCSRQGQRPPPRLVRLRSFARYGWAALAALVVWGTTSFIWDGWTQERHEWRLLPGPGLFRQWSLAPDDAGEIPFGPDDVAAFEYSDPKEVAVRLYQGDQYRFVLAQHRLREVVRLWKESARLQSQRPGSLSSSFTGLEPRIVLSVTLTGFDLAVLRKLHVNRMMEEAAHEAGLSGRKLTGIDRATLESRAEEAFDRLHGPLSRFAAAEMAREKIGNLREDPDQLFQRVWWAWLPQHPGYVKALALAVWAFLGLAVVGLGWILVHFVGDVVAYVPPGQLTKFWDLRRTIRAEACDLGRFVYGRREHDDVRTAPFFYDEVVIVGHSLGSVVGYDALNQLILSDRLHKETSLDVARRTRAFVTFGSPLEKTAFLFRSQAEETSAVREELAQEVQPLIDSYQWRQFHWVNVHSESDVISSALTAYDCEKADGFDERWRVENVVDPEADIPFLAHVMYWRGNLLRDVLRKELLFERWSPVPQGPKGTDPRKTATKVTEAKTWVQDRALTKDFSGMG
jgi:hypothetical protein